MRRSKRMAQAFINHLFGIYGVPRIPITVKWHYNSVITQEHGAAFGVYCYGNEEPECIYVAAKKIKTSATLISIAHEFVHYLQRLYGRDMDDTEQIEKDAEYWACGLYGLWAIGERSICPNAWEAAT